jgi:hypothetical protein
MGSNEGPAQADNLQRVASRIERLILDFARTRWLSNPTFHMQDLTSYVDNRAPIAPDSAGRILRHLRAAGLVDYVVLNRRASLYQLTKVRAS